MEKVNFKFGVLSLVLVFALVFATPLCVGCSNEVKTDKEIVSAVLTDAQAAVLKMYKGGNTASNSTNSAPLLTVSDMNNITLNNANFATNNPSKKSISELTVMFTDLVFRLGVKMANEESYTLGNVVKNKYTITTADTEDFHYDTWKSSATGIIYEKINFSKADKKVTCELYFVTTNSYVNADLYYDSNYKVVKCTFDLQQKNYFSMYFAGEAEATSFKYAYYLLTGADVERAVLNDAADDGYTSSSANSTDKKYVTDVTNAANSFLSSVQTLTGAGDDISSICVGAMRTSDNFRYDIFKE